MVDLTDKTLMGKLQIAQNVLKLFPESWKEESACVPMNKLTDEEFVEYSEKKGLNNLLFNAKTEECFRFQLMRRKMKVRNVMVGKRPIYHIVQ